MDWDDYAYEEMLMVQHTWSESVEDYIAEHNDQELIVEAREVLSSTPNGYIAADIAKIHSILIKGIAYQRFSPKQRYAIADFILTNT
jgi:hypothetical protein